jgi:hypothetical protein
MFIIYNDICKKRYKGYNAPAEKGVTNVPDQNVTNAPDVPNNQAVVTPVDKPTFAEKEVQTSMRQYFGRLVAPSYIMDHSQTAKSMQRFIFNRVCDDKTNDVCCICLQSFMARSTIHAPCGHIFHYTCFCDLGKQHRKCPLCLYKFNGADHK